MSKYIKLEDAIRVVADQYMFEATMDSPYASVDIKDYIELGEELFKDLPTIEVSEDAIGRQAVIDLARKGVLISNSNFDKVCNAINSLPSVVIPKEELHIQKEQAYMQGYEDASKKYRPTEDVISREWVYKAIEDYAEEHGISTHLYLKDFIMKFIDTAPSVFAEDAISIPKGWCGNCRRSSDYCCKTDEDKTRCPIEEHYTLPKYGFCHLYEAID